MVGITKSDFESMGGRAGGFKIGTNFGRSVVVALTDFKRKVYFLTILFLLILINFLACLDQMILINSFCILSHQMLQMIKKYN